MSLGEQLRKEAPKNDHTVSVRRARIAYQSEEGRKLTPAKKRLLESGALDIIEELLEVVDGSSFAMRPFEEAERLVARFKDLASDSLLGNKASLYFEWGAEFAPSRLSISSDILSENIHIESFSPSGYNPNSLSSQIFKRTLTPEQWRNRTEVDVVVIEALTLAGLTQRQLKGGINE